jgi:tetratricopeptide (TPR) repeat protein
MRSVCGKLAVMVNHPSRLLAVPLLLVLAGAPAMAAMPQTPASPAPPSDSLAKERAALFRALAAAKTEPEARTIEGLIWKLWLTAPDAESQRLLDAAKDAQQNFDYGSALAALDRLIKHAPDYAEAWNQRAIVLFMTGEYEKSLDAIEEVLKREPKHFGALAGKGIILMMRGRTAEGQAALKQAFKIDPCLKERGLIADEPGQKI